MKMSLSQRLSLTYLLWVVSYCYFYNFYVPHVELLVMVVVVVCVCVCVRARAYVRACVRVFVRSSSRTGFVTFVLYRWIWMSWEFFL